MIRVIERLLPSPCLLERTRVDDGGRIADAKHGDEALWSDHGDLSPTDWPARPITCRRPRVQCALPHEPRSVVDFHERSVGKVAQPLTVRSAHAKTDEPVGVEPPIH